MLTASLSRAILASALFLGGCAAQYNTSPCDRAPQFITPGTHLIIAPASGSGGPATRDDLSRVAALLQIASSSLSDDYPGVKVVRLTADRTNDSACRREAIKYLWSGCSKQGRRPILVGGDSVSVVWSNAVEVEGATLVQFAMSNWRIEDEFALRLTISDRDEKYDISARVPVDEIVFAPHSLPIAQVQQITASFSCELLESPVVGARQIGPAGCGTTFDGRVIGKTKDRQKEWLHIELPDGRGSGWLAVPPREQISTVFPEFDVAAMALAFQEYFRIVGAGRDAFEKVDKAYKRLSSASVKSRDPSADLMMTAVVLDHALQTGRLELLETASKLANLARTRLPDDPQIANLIQLIEFARCCAVRPTGARANFAAEYRAPATTKLSEFVASSHWLVYQNPANSIYLDNLLTFIELLEKKGETIYRDVQLRQWREGLEVVAKARHEADSRQSACETWRSEAAAIEQKPFWQSSAYK